MERAPNSDIPIWYCSVVFMYALPFGSYDTKLSCEQRHQMPFPFGVKKLRNTKLNKR